MDKIFKNLHKDVALKFDENIILGKENVSKYIINNENIFINILVKPIEESHMFYGFTSNGNPVKIGFENNLIRRIIIITKPTEYTRYKMTISYDGHRYNGFQIQDNKKTIQGELSKIITKTNGYETLVQGASRTDKGVHANFYVAHFDSIRDISPNKWELLLNYQLPKDIMVLSVKEIHPIFHSRYDVYLKSYIYKIRLGKRNPFKINYEWNIEKIDLEILSSALKEFIGKHDFSSFCMGNSTNSIRTIYEANYDLVEDYLILEFKGNGFLRHMIRIMVNTIVEISTHNLDVSITEILKEKSRIHTKNMAPASGLYLNHIIY